MNFYQSKGKRLIDVILGSVLFLIFSPIIWLSIIVTWYNFGRPVFYCQIRPGLGGIPFVLHKLRTMHDVYDHNGLPIPDELRMTRVSKWLRSTSIDELPELYDVVRGKMSLVGPRPLLIEYLPIYTAEQMHRHDVKPGITGWAQINGRNNIDWQQKFELDLWYVDNISFKFDLLILIMTVVKTLRRESINQTGQATVEYFKGNETE